MSCLLDSATVVLPSEDETTLLAGVRTANANRTKAWGKVAPWEGKLAPCEGKVAPCEGCQGSPWNLNGQTGSAPVGT